MLMRNLGDMKVSAIGLGCWAIGGPFNRTAGVPMGWGDIDDNESIRALHCAFDLGINFIDTANNYGAGHSERVVAQAIENRRDKVVVATKFGSLFSEQTHFHIDHIDDFELIIDKRFIQNALAGSLRRLNTDYIDLYQFHWGNYDIERAPEVRDALEDFVAEGKIRAYGWSTDDPERAAIFAQGEHCAAIQHDLSVLNDAVEMLDVCVVNGMASINKKPLAGGFLADKFTQATQFPENDLRSSIDMSSARITTRLTQIDALREILTSDGRTMAQGALCWNLARSSHTIPIPGFKNEHQVRDNAQALEFGQLTNEQMLEISNILQS